MFYKISKEECEKDYGFKDIKRWKDASIIEIPENITRIGNFAFYGCKVKEIKTTNSEISDLPKSVKEIGHYAFFNCKNLDNICLQHVEKIGDCAFVLCKFENINLFDELNKNAIIGNCAFGFCYRLKNIKINKPCKIGFCAFGRCENLENIELPINCELNYRSLGVLTS